MLEADRRSPSRPEEPPGPRDDRVTQATGPTPDAAPPPSPGPGLLASMRSAPATVLFLGACVALFVVAESHGSTTDTETLIRFGANERAHVWAGEWWRLLTAGFLHIGLAHLAWNVVGMFGWCVPLERALGRARFALVYLGSLLAASAASILLHDVVSAGASGAGFGIIGATLALGRRRLGSWRAFADDPRVRRIAGTVVVWTLVLSWMNVDHAAHGGGFVAGIALTWALTAPAAEARGARRAAWAVAILVVAAPLALALVPRAGGSRWAGAALEAELYVALKAEDLDAAERVLARADAAGLRSPRVELDRAVLLLARGDRAGAARRYEELAGAADPEIRRMARSAARALLAERLLLGDGMRADPARARGLLEQACAEREEHICAWLRANPIRDADAPPPAASDSPPVRPRRSPRRRPSPRGHRSRRPGPSPGCATGRAARAAAG